MKRALTIAGVAVVVIAGITVAEVRTQSLSASGPVNNTHVLAQCRTHVGAIHHV